VLGAGPRGEPRPGSLLGGGLLDDGENLLVGGAPADRCLDGDREPAQALVVVGAGTADAARVGERLGDVSGPRPRRFDRHHALYCPT